MAQPHIKSNEIACMNWLPQVFHVTSHVISVVTGAVVTHVIHCITNISFDFLTLCLSHDVP